MGHKQSKQVIRETVAAVIVAGVVIAVVIAGYQHYQIRTRTAEAIWNVDKMFEGAVVYFDDSSPEISCRHCLPASNKWTPPLETIGASQYEIGKDSFELDATWEALNFPPFTYYPRNSTEMKYLYFSYKFVSCTQGAGGPCAPGSTISCQASGDLDEDGKYSFFERGGEIVADPDGMSIMRAAGIYKRNPYE
ncbi:MAG: hypothetical protein GY847_16460 [Proteobacteria bacterium]|nr:hypothetical protein [Pseudomonadota bacterium]